MESVKMILIISYLIHCSQRILTGNIFIILRRQPFQNSINQQRPPGDPLHGQHQKRVQRQRLTRRTILQLLQQFQKRKTLSANNNTKKS